MTNEDKQLSELLKTDAKIIRKTETFDPKLHQDIIREIRNLESSETESKRKHKVPIKLAAGMALVTTITVISLSLFQPSQEHPISNPPAIASPTQHSTVIEYRKILLDREDKFIAKLDQDARILLQRSADVFQSNPQ